MSWWDGYWLAWLAAVFAGFLPVEVYALATRHTEHTLSGTVWTWTSNDLTHPWNIGSWTWPHWLLAAFMIWLTLHLVWGLLR